MQALLVHSPLVGPSSMRHLADELAAAGWAVTVPDLRDAAITPAAFVDRAIESTASADVVIGHSGAGAMLPLVAAAFDATAAFVDAIVPGREGHEPSPGFQALIDDLRVFDGSLPPWHEWWPAATLERLVPDAALRAQLIDEIPRVPRSFYDHRVVLPPEWWTRPAVYLQLSPAYDDDRARAESYGWPTASLDGQHLDLVTRPADVAALNRDLVTRTH